MAGHMRGFRELSLVMRTEDGTIPPTRNRCKAILFTLFAVSLTYPGLAQNIPSRINSPWDEARRTVLQGNTHPWALPEFDLGTAAANLPMERMLLVLKRSPEQEADLRQLLNEQQVRNSPNYHQWLTPDQFGTRFGPSDGDLQIVRSWLEYHGFRSVTLSRGRTAIEFSGSAGQVKEAFHTDVHKYLVSEEEHWANSTDPEIPSALMPVVGGIASLHNFGRKALHQVAAGFRSQGTGKKQPSRPTERQGSEVRFGGVCGLLGIPCNFLGPYDFATIYNVLPLWNATSSIDGTGETIAIVGQSDIYPQDFSNFRQDFGLPAGKLVIIYNGSPPNKLASQGDELESDLDVEWAGAVAKGATIDLVASTTTNSTAGVDLSALYIVDNNLAPVMSESYGACELEMGTAGNRFYNQLWEQAAAQGITVFVSTGDSGSAVCDQGTAIATHGLAVNGIASTPFNVAVGGTDFDDSQNNSLYWNSTNDPVTLASAKSYVPEMTWNDTCTSSEFFPLTGKIDAESDCNAYNSQYWPSFVPPVGGSGGASNCIQSQNQSVSSCAGGYAKPAWQSGPGVPSDGARNVPDVSLFAGDGLNASAYLVCETDIYEGCAGETYTLVPVGGTSASAPTFAGIMAMIVQSTHSRQGNANYVFYPLAAQPGASCDSTGTIASSCIFYDVTVGTIAMPCTPATPNCVTNVVGDQAGVLSGYSTTPGFDLGTGLGSVNAANLATNWSSVTFQPTSSTLSLSPTNLTHGSPVSVNVSVTPNAGTGTPTGQVSLLTSQGLSAGTFTLSNGYVSSTTTLLPGGSYTVSSNYAGDGTYAASDSAPGVAVTVTAEPSTTTVLAYTVGKNGNFVPFSTGQYGQDVVYLQANVAGQSAQGVATGTVNLTETKNGTTANVPGDPFSLNSQGYFIPPLLGAYNFFTTGTYTIGATYSGDGSFKASSTPGATFTITPAQTNVSTNILACTPGNSPCVFGAGNFIQIFAFVNYTTTGFSAQPTGTVTFLSNGTALTAPIPIDSSISPPVASFNTNQMPLGLDSITVQYSGDSNFNGSTSPAALIDVGGAYTVSANPTTITVATPGQSGSTTLTFSTQNGLTGTGTLSPSMCSNLPPYSTCSFSPSTVTFTSSTTTVPVTLTITTTASGSAVSSARQPWSTTGRRLLETTAVFCFGVFLLPLSLRKRDRRGFVAVVALVAIATAVACGGGGGSGGGGGGGAGGGGGGSGTMPGTYNGVTLNIAVAGLSQFVYVNVNVQ
jgi:subtilase family serine protease